MQKRKRKTIKAKKWLKKRRHLSFWERNRDGIITGVINRVIAGIIVFLVSKGLEIVCKYINFLRFTNTEIYENINGVISKIMEYIRLLHLP